MPPQSHYWSATSLHFSLAKNHLVRAVTQYLSLVVAVNGHLAPC